MSIIVFDNYLYIYVMFGARITVYFLLQDKSGQLDKNEFRACLLSLGYKLGNDPVSITMTR